MKKEELGGSKEKRLTPEAFVISLRNRLLNPSTCEGGFLSKHAVIMYYPQESEFWTKSNVIVQAILKKHRDSGYNVTRRGDTYIIKTKT